MQRILRPVVLCLICCPDDHLRLINELTLFRPQTHKKRFYTIELNNTAKLHSPSVAKVDLSLPTTTKQVSFSF